MAQFVSFSPFDINSINLYWYNFYGIDSALEKNANIAFNGNVYPDLVWVEGYDGIDDLELDFLGSGINTDLNGNITSGTVNVVGEYDWLAGEYLWYAEGITLSAVSIYNAAQTVSNLDEIGLIQTALAGNDTVILSPYADRMGGYAGNDTITGGLGADILSGGTGNDIFRDTKAGLSGDTITDFAIGDKIVITDAALAGFTFSLAGSTVTYTGGSLTLQGTLTGALNASAAAGGGVELWLQAPIIGTSGNDTLNGTEFADQINGLDGHDTLNGLGGADILNGGAGDDMIDGGDGADQIHGGEGNDQVTSTSGADTIDGGNGYDTWIGNFSATSVGLNFGLGQIITVSNGLTATGFEVVSIGGGSGNDHFDIDRSGFLSIAGGAGYDSLVYRPASPTEGQLFAASTFGSTISGSAGEATFQDVESVELNGTGFADAFSISGQFLAGALAINGGAGTDHLGASFGSATTFVVRADGSIESNRGSFSSLETFSILGSVEADTFSGGAGADEIDGYDGNDVVAGGAGTDTLYGGAGADTFRDTAANLTGDTIGDLNVGDRIVISDASLSGFNFSLTGETLTYTGGSLTLQGGVMGHLVASAAAGGGVQLLLQEDLPDAVRNDFNGDGRSDILWRSDAGHLSNWLGTESGGFLNNDANAFTQVSTDWWIAGTGDFNGDGHSDILWWNEASQLSNWLGQAGGGFANNDANAFTTVADGWQVVGTGDFNGDHKDDLLWRGAGGELSNWLGQDNGGFIANDANALSSAPLDWQVVGTGDFNGDGFDDILWRSQTGQLSDWLGNEAGGFTNNDGNAFANVPTNWSVVGTGDFNGDGRDDILWRSETGELSNWLGTENGGFVNNDANAFTNVSTSWHVVAVGDYNGDGFDDILWRDAGGGLSDWLGTEYGGFVTNDVNAATTVATNWHTQPEAPLV